MKTPVTGATGFIGNHLVRTLINAGREIRCFVRERRSNAKDLGELEVDINGFY